MSQEAYDKYMVLEAQLMKVRRKHEGRVSEEELDAMEDPILDSMDPLWWEMTREEQERLEKFLNERRARSEIP